MPDYRTPGVYIEELPAEGPIAGVGTSTAAFLGPALKGPINDPTKITNWTQFKDGFGTYITAPAGRFFLAHAVRGFFENGGTVAYIVRVGSAQRAFRNLDDRGAAPAGQAIHVEAKQEGAPGNTITVQVQNAEIVDAAQTARVRRAQAPIASAANDTITLQNLADAALFRPGDTVTIQGSAERVEIARIRNELLFVTPNLTAAYGATQPVRIADLIAGQLRFRIENPNGIEPGSVLHLAQGATNEDRVVEAVAGEFVRLAGTGLTNGYPMTGATQVAVTTLEFNLLFSRPGPPAVAETFPELSMDPRHSRYYGRTVISALVNVSPPQPPSVQLPPNNRPAVIGPANLAGGADDNLGTVGAAHYQAALAALEKVDDVSLVCVPNAVGTGTQGDVIGHCERMLDRFAILDSAFNAPPFGVGSVEGQRAAVESQRGYAALYYPWIRIMDPLSLTGEETMLVPPCGHMAGIYARSDNERGVHKAPANEYLRGVVGLERIVDHTEQGELNVAGVNVLRIFPGAARPIVWAARTTAPKDVTAWRYVNVRRLFLFVEESIQEGLRWGVFEPNDLGLWQKLKRTISEFLTRVWRSGALFGATAAEAFYVKVDEELNPPGVRALGQVIIEIGIAPVRPAEFIVVRIGIWEGGSEATEA